MTTAGPILAGPTLTPSPILASAATASMSGPSASASASYPSPSSQGVGTLGASTSSMYAQSQAQSRSPYLSQGYTTSHSQSAGEYDYLPTPQSMSSPPLPQQPYYPPTHHLSHQTSPQKYRSAGNSVPDLVANQQYHASHQQPLPQLPHPGSYAQPQLHSHSVPHSHNPSPGPVAGYMSPASTSTGNDNEWNSQQAGPSSYRRQSAYGEGREFDEAAARIQYEDGRVGVEDPFGERSYTEVKCLGDGSFGTVWLCDWHSPVRSGTRLSAMQCGAGARPEWSGKRLVALKRMKRVWEGGWSQAKNLGELASLRSIPPHDAIIPLYDAFISPKSRELYFVFECMEGNLYQLTKSRRGRPLAAGLIASCFHQISSGLHHIHRYGYFHRDMKPENLLVTTTGLTDYLTAATLNSMNMARGSSSGSDEPLPRTPNGVEMRYEKDVAVIVKLADFGLARETSSKPPYTEYVSTRWYRAPEVLLRSREYGPPVDMWALGTILAEMLNLKPLFPGVSEIDQVYRICDTMGDPSAEYGHDERGRTRGGGSWNTGIKLAKNVGFSFPKRTPANFRGLFADTVPQSLVDCIADLLRYNPRYRLTSAQCVEHPYFHETLPHLRQTPPLPRVPFSQGQPPPGALKQPQAPLDVPPRQLPPSHSHQAAGDRPAFANGDMRTLPPPMGTPDGTPNSRLFIPSLGNQEGRSYGASALVNQLRELDLPTDDLASYGNRPPPSPGSASHPSAQPSFDNYDPAATPNMANYQTLSVSNLHLNERPSRPSQSSVAAFVAQQQQLGPRMYEDGSTPRQASSSQLPMAPPPIEPTIGGAKPPPQILQQHQQHQQAMAMAITPAAQPISKKKKWGLSSVFGSSEKHLPSVDEHSATAAAASQSSVSAASGSTTSFLGSSSLKRTQSGNPPPDAAIRQTAPVDPSTILDPKKAKKEAERQAKELEKAKREAAVRAQKERARAVMQKRSQIQDERGPKALAADLDMGGSFAEVEAVKVDNVNNLGGSGGVGRLGRANMISAANLASASRLDVRRDDRAVQQQRHGSQAHIPQQAPPSHRPPQQQQPQQPAQQQQYQQPQHQHSQHQFHSQPPPHVPDHLPPSTSLPSIRSSDSVHSYSAPPVSSQAQLNAATLAARDGMEREKDPAYLARHKARRRDDDDDHSMSSFDVNSLKSRSALTVGTIDSDPGARRQDPLLEAQARRHASHGLKSSSHRSSSKSRLMSGSNPSLESQLAHEFRMHANLASASSASLSRLGQGSSLNLADMPPLPPLNKSVGPGGSGAHAHGQGTYDHPALAPMPGSTAAGFVDSSFTFHNQPHPSQAQGTSGQSPIHPHTHSLAHGQRSAPTSPYGHPKGDAVARGQGIGRDHIQQSPHAGSGHSHGHQLPPISDWEGHEPVINPMFRVPPVQGQTTLPPFSTLASVADQQRPGQ